VLAVDICPSVHAVPHVLVHSSSFGLIPNS
jgi:hypothetical protein